jgi:hypothetical protein
MKEAAWWWKCTEKIIYVFFVQWRGGDCHCLVGCWLGGFVPAVVSEGPLY